MGFITHVTKCVNLKHGSDLSKELGLLLLGTFLSLGSGSCICASEIQIYIYKPLNSLYLQPGLNQSTVLLVFCALSSVASKRTGVHHVLMGLVYVFYELLQEGVGKTLLYGRRVQVLLPYTPGTQHQTFSKPPPPQSWNNRIYSTLNNLYQYRHLFSGWLFTGVFMSFHPAHLDTV